jgi:hypothetical protein
MDHRNKAITNPDAFAVNTAMQRCLAKAIALHGIGLYIYAGEDIPQDDDGNAASKPVSKPATAPATQTNSDDRQELIDLCYKAADGDHDLAATILKVCSIFTGKDGVEHFIKPDTIKKATDKHVEASLRNFRKKSESGDIAAIVEDYHQGRAM